MSGPWEDFKAPAQSQAAGPWQDFSQPAATADGPWKDFKQEETPLFSEKGAKSIFSSFAPSITKSIMGWQLGHYEELQNARERERARGAVIPVDQEELDRLDTIKTKRKAIELIGQDVHEMAPNPSWPLRIATGAAHSAMAMGPGLAVGGAARVLGGMAAIPAIQQGMEQSFGSTYAEARVPSEPKKIAASVENALAHARVSSLVEGAFEVHPMGKLFEEVGKTGVGELLKRYILREYKTEIPTTIAQDLSEWSTVAKDMPLGEFAKKVWSDVIDTAATVPLAAGATGAFARGTVKLGQASTLQPWEEYQQGPSGEKIAVTTPSIDRTKPPPPPIPSGPPTPEIAALIKSIDETLDPDTITDDDVEQARAAVLAHEKERLAPPTQRAAIHDEIDSLNSRGDLGEIGESGKVAAKAKEYINENDSLPRSQRPIAYGPRPEMSGMTLEQVEWVPGTYTVGTPTLDRNAETLQAQHETIEQWRQKFMPNARFVLLNESLPTDTATGWHSRLSDGTHLITPAVLRQMKSSATFNTNAQGKLFYNLAHEFGHALVYDRFFEGADPLLSATIRAEAQKGVVSEELIMQLPELQQTVLREYNAIKQEVLDGSMTAGDFHLRWMNPAKVHKYSTISEHSVPPTAPATQLVDSIIRRAFRNNQMLDAKQLMSLRNEYLGLDEYLAEQTARYAYSKEFDKQAPQSMQGLIGRALQSVRNSLAQFFKMLKQQDIIAPGVRFQEWLDSLTKEPASEVKVGKAKGRAKKTGSQKAGEEVAAQLPASAKKRREPPDIEHNVETTSVDRQKAARAAVLALTKDGTIEAGSERYKELMGLIKAQDFDTFTDEIQPYIEKKVKFEVDDDVPNHAASSDSKVVDINRDAQKEWQEKGFSSKYFKAWFGDWQVDPENASKVLNANGEPLIVYHATTADFEQFYSFSHFGTPRAANNRIGQFPEEKEGWQIMPVVLNIQNPLVIQEGKDPFFWFEAAEMSDELHSQGLITLQEAEEILNAPAIPGDPLRAVRDVLERKGYDGLKYQNVVEGDTSWVTFRPEQVKSVLGTKQFGKSPKIHFELDFDESTASGYNAGQFYRKFKNLVPNKGNLRRALRHVKNWQFNVLQAQQLAHIHPEEADLQFFVEKANEYERFKSELQARANGVAEQLYNLGKERYAKFSKFLLAEQASGTLWVDLVKDPNGTWIYQTSETFRLKLEEQGVDTTTPQGEELAALILDYKNVLLERLNQKEKVLNYLLGSRYRTNPQLLALAVKPIRRDIHALRKQPFVPQGRFGNHILVVERKRTEGPGYEVVYREAFENAQERNEAAKRAEVRVKEGERVKSKDLTDTEYVLMSLPQDFLELVISELGLKEDQMERLYEVLSPIKKEKLLKPYDIERLKVAGASKDLRRSFANFIWHDANMLAKTRYRADFNLALRGIGAKLRKVESANDGPAIAYYSKMHRFLEGTRDHIMSPPHEMHMLRSFVALSYLAYNVKTAALNLFGLMTTYAHLNTTYGPVRGHRLFLQGSVASTRSINPLDLNARREGNYLKPELQEGLDRAIREGQLTQSYAYHLAGMANSDNLQRMPGRDILGKTSRRAIDLGMWVFRLTELQTRRISFLAELQGQLEAREENPTQWDAAHPNDTPYDVAIASTNKLQNDYSLSNRPVFLRGWQNAPKYVQGIPPLVTVFASFTQHMAFHALGGYGLGMRRAAKMSGVPMKFYQSYTAQLLVILLVLAGYEGLPMSENILDLLDWIWKKIKGVPFRQNVRENLREAVKTILDIDSDPLTLAHGLSHNTNFFGMTGDNRFDISRSVGLGRVFPGTDVLAQSKTDVTGGAGKFLFALMGPFGSQLHWLLEISMGDKSWRENLRRAPGAVGNIVSSYDFSKHGLRGPHDGLISRDPERGELRDLTTVEIFGKALGFNPSVVSENREIYWSQHDARMYWQGRRKGLLDQYWDATWQQDREALADVRESIQKYNEFVPQAYAKLRLTPKEINDSMKVRRRQQGLEQRDLPMQKRYRALHRDVRESFENDPSR